jgi:RNA polymerase sigma-70 factor (subfamily 1)
LLEKFRLVLLQKARKRTGHDLQAKFGDSDLIQDALFRAQRDFKAFEGKTVNEFALWLIRILINSHADLRRYYCIRGKRTVTKEVSLEVGFPIGRGEGAPAARYRAPCEAMIQNEQRESLARTLAKMPSEQRQMIELRIHLEVSFKDTADRLGTTEDTARKRFERAVAHIKMGQIGGNE